MISHQITMNMNQYDISNWYKYGPSNRLIISPTQLKSVPFCADLTTCPAGKSTAHLIFALFDLDQAAEVVDIARFGQQNHPNLCFFFFPVRVLSAQIALFHDVQSRTVFWPTAMLDGWESCITNISTTCSRETIRGSFWSLHLPLGWSHQRVRVRSSGNRRISSHNPSTNGWLSGYLQMLNHPFFWGSMCHFDLYFARTTGIFCFIYFIWHSRFHHVWELYQCSIINGFILSCIVPYSSCNSVCCLLGMGFVPSYHLLDSEGLAQPKRCLRFREVFRFYQGHRPTEVLWFCLGMVSWWVLMGVSSSAMASFGAERATPTCWKRAKE